MGIDQVSEGMSVQLTVDRDRRMAIMRNHTATHLLNQSLRNHLGSHVVQQGSQVSDKTLRFDFNHYQNVTVEEILSIEKEVNQVIQSSSGSNQRNADGRSFETRRPSLVRRKIRRSRAGGRQSVQHRIVWRNPCGKYARFETVCHSRFGTKGSGVFRIEAATYPALKEQIARVTKATAENIAYLEIKLDRIIKEAEAEGIEIKKNRSRNSRFTQLSDIINTQIKYQEASRIVKEAEKQFDRLYRQAKTSITNNFCKCNI